LACQVYEFTHFVYHEGHELTLSSYQGEPHVFGSTFYVLTGTHGTHVAIGVFWLLGWFVYSFTGKMSTVHAIDVECCGLYWHFVDIVWIIIFPVVYLMEYAM
jgi:heme/copper-type cytochrome/quinol oxidase subunit 3